MSFGRTMRFNRGVALLLVVCLFVMIYFVAKPAERQSRPYPIHPIGINLRKLLIGAIQAAEKGGIEVVDVALNNKLNKKSKGKTKEGADDPVTDADGRSHCVMKEGLHRLFPRLNIISEEDKEHGKCSEGKHFDLDPTVLHRSEDIVDEIVNIKDITVWIDPLDATQEYTEQLFHFVTTMVCVAVKGIPTIGVIHNPFTKQTTWAWLDRALSEDLQKVKKDDTQTKNPIIIVSRSHSGDVKNTSKTVFGENSHIVIAAGAGYKVLQVVFNNATAYLHTTRIKKWDICSGDAILRSLGGRMTNLQDENIDYSAEGSVVNDKGLLAALNNHDDYITKLMTRKFVER